jgi:hypothetical protein
MLALCVSLILLSAELSSNSRRTACRGTRLASSAHRAAAVESRSSAPTGSRGPCLLTRKAAKGIQHNKSTQSLHAESPEKTGRQVPLLVSYRAKGINRFTSVNLRLPGSNRIAKDFFFVAALVSTGSPTATARLLCSTETG